MKKILTAFLAIWSMTTMAGLPPTSMQGDQSSKIGTFNFKVPNNQATQVTGGTRNETGNTNLLANPSFEHSTFNTGWTTALGTASLTTNALNAGSVTEGLQAYKITSAGAGVRVAQVSTINAAGLKGQQMVARAKIYSSDSVLQMCALVDNISTGDTNCTTVPVTDTNTPFKLVEIPFTAGGTSNGIVIKSATTTAQTIYIDDVSVGAASPFQNVQGAQLVGTLTISGCASQWSTTSTTYVSFSAQTGCTYTATGQVQAPSTQLPAVKIPNMAAGDYKIEFEGGLFQNTAGKTAKFRWTDGTNFTREESLVYAGSSTIFQTNINHSISYSTSQSNVTLQMQGKTDTGGGAYVYLDSASANIGVIKVWYFPPASKIYSQTAVDTQYITATATTATFGSVNTSVPILTIVDNNSTGYIQVNSNSTDGTSFVALQDTIINVSGTCSAGTGGTCYISKNASVLVSSGAPGAGAALMSGIVQQQSTAGDLNISGEYRIARGDTIRFQRNSTAGITGFGPIAITARSVNNIITGSFSGIEKCANDYECTSGYDGKISTSGVASNQNLPWISSASWGSTGNLTVVPTAGIFVNSVPNCTATTDFNSASNAATVVFDTANSTTSSLKFYTTVQTTAGSSAATTSTFGVTVHCEKGTNDFKAKTGKIASSIGVPTVPGITTAGTGNLIDFFSASFGGASVTTACASSPCTQYEVIGPGGFSTITRSATQNYGFTTVKTYANLKCWGTAYGASGEHWYRNTTSSGPLRCTNCNSLSFSSPRYDTGGAAEDVFGTLTCMGTY